MAKVVCVGISVLDQIFNVERLPAQAIKHYATGRREVTGGIAANGARAVARLGGIGVLVSRVGGDLAGDAVRSELADEGVDLDGLATLADRRTSLSAVIIDAAGERMIVNDADADLVRGTEQLSLTPFANAQAVLADARWADAAVLAMEQAASLGVPGILDFDRVPEPPGWEPLLELSSHVVFGAEGLAELTGTSDLIEGLHQVRLRSTALLAVTAGKDGVLWLEGQEVHRQPGFTIAPVDTLAAGDIFHGAFALALAEARPLAEAFRFAAGAAALKCTRHGGGAAAPYRAELDAFLLEHA